MPEEYNFVYISLEYKDEESGSNKLTGGAIAGIVVAYVVVVSVAIGVTIYCIKCKKPEQPID